VCECSTHLMDEVRVNAMNRMCAIFNPVGVSVGGNTKICYEASRKLLILMVSAVGIEPTT
jgi:hypothetical protein